MAHQYESVVETVTAIDLVFDNLKEIYTFLGYADVTFSIKSRNLSAIITDHNERKIPMNKNDFVVKNDKKEIFVMSKDEFNKKYKIKGA